MTESNRETREIVAHNIESQRKRAGFSVRLLAKEASIDERLLRRYMTASHEPTTRNLLRIAGVIGQSLEWFYEDHRSEARRA